MTISMHARLARMYGRKSTALSRREMLRATLAASAGLLISTTPLSAFTRLGRDSKKRIVIIGGGFSGLASAYELKAAGYDVTVVEARSRVGGRVISLNAANNNEFIKGRNIEAGGELIGSNHPAWVSYKDKFGLEFLDVTEDEGEAIFPVVIDGKQLEYEEAAKLWEDMEAGLGKMNELAATVLEDEPWNTPDAAKLDGMSIADWIKSTDLPELVKRAMLINQVSDNGQPAEKQSLLGQLTAVKGGGLEKYWTDSEVFRCKGGNDQLAKKLAEGIGVDRVNLKLSVRSVKQKGDILVVECADGRTMECDDVVFTVPPPLWSKVELSPALPAAMKPQMGLNTKYLVHVKDRFWEKGEPKRSQYALSDGLVQQTWDGTDAQGPVEASNGGACMTGFSGGPSVEKLLAMSAEDAKTALATEYEKFYPGCKDNVVASKFMAWPKDPLTGASYSFPAPGQVTTVGPLMAKAYMGSKLHLAGEHTCYKFVGYMEGALSSGVRVAKKLAMRDGVMQDAK